MEHKTCVGWFKNSNSLILIDRLNKLNVKFEFKPQNQSNFWLYIDDKSLTTTFKDPVINLFVIDETPFDLCWMP